MEMYINAKEFLKKLLERDDLLNVNTAIWFDEPLFLGNCWFRFYDNLDDTTRVLIDLGGHKLDFDVKETDLNKLQKEISKLLEECEEIEAVYKDFEEEDEG